MKLDRDFINRTRRRIEELVVPAMEKYYLHDGVTFGDDFRPGLKHMEKIVSYYDYYACGFSVIARLAAGGDRRAAVLVPKILDNMDHYRTAIWGHAIPGHDRWEVPLRRLIFHMALGYRALEPHLSDGEKQRYRALADQQVPAAIEHCRGFLPGVTDLHLARVNNHTAIFMQGVYYAGLVFGREEWCAMARDFGERYYASGHPDGYFEENTNAEREGGPSMVYTPLTAGCLYDVLDGKNKRQDKFVKAGDFYRSFLDHDYRMIPLADERTNSNGKPFGYGLALHSLTPRGRGFIVDAIDHADLAAMSPEGLAVLNHELDLMAEGDCEVPESRTDGMSRIILPLGMVRKNGFTAGLSALKALNRVINPKSDYALDQQAMVYLSHAGAGTILTANKSKNDPSYSTFRIGDDAYTVRTGELDMADGRGSARLYYDTFNAVIRWELGKSAVLTLSVDTDKPVFTALTITDPGFIRTAAKFAIRDLKGFSPYTAGNADKPVKAAVFEWTGELKIEFKT